MGMKQLRPITKSVSGTLDSRTGRVRRNECWEAATVDGEWAFERLEDVGTPWVVIHNPGTPQAETVATLFGTLKSARQAVERGIEQWLPSVQQAAHDRGDHANGSPYGCRTCDNARWAR